MNPRSIIIFIRNPVEGKVKTRLAKDIGDKNALKVYNVLLDHTRNISLNANADIRLFYDEYIVDKDEWNVENVYKHLQVSGDLGKRMSSAFDLVFSLGYASVLIIGSDCIELNTQHIELAYKQLETHDFVIGPAKDGGYYLLGMKKPETILFKNKKWSSTNVFNETLADLHFMNSSYFLLPTLSDVDTIDDLNETLMSLIK